MKRTLFEEYAWVGPLVQCVVGALVGTLVGIGIYFEFFDEGWGWLAIPAGALVFGTLAAIYGDRFWIHWLDGDR
jgi:hypothetical protein